MNEIELRNKFPNASSSFITINAGPEGIPSPQPERTSGETLVPAVAGETAGRESPAVLFGGPVRITFAFYARKPKDASNHFIKYLEDGLVACGILPDDNYAVVKEIVLRSVKINSRSNQMTLITIDALEEL